MAVIVALNGKGDAPNAPPYPTGRFAPDPPRVEPGPSPVTVKNEMPPATPPPVPAAPPAAGPASPTPLELAAPHLARGEAHKDEHEYDAAIADYTEAIRIDPKLALAYYCRGVAFDAKGCTSSTRRLYRRRRGDPT